MSALYHTVNVKSTMKPLRYQLPLTHDQLEARKTMPRVTGDWIVGLPWCVDKDVRRTEPLWREWCKANPKHLWPDWLDTWADVRRMRGLA